MKKKAVLDFEKANMKNRFPDFDAGDTIEMTYRFEEGGKERFQLFKGVVIENRGDGLSKTFTVRKLVQGVGIEKSVLLCSPFVTDIKLIRRGKVKRAKLYYLRGRSGKATRIAERLGGRLEKEAEIPEATTTAGEG